MALSIHWSLKNISLLIGCCIFVVIYTTSRLTHSSNPASSLLAASSDDFPPLHHGLDWDIPGYVPPPPPPSKPKPPPVPWAEAKFKHDAEEAAARRKADHEREIANSPEAKRKASALLAKIAAEQQKALAEQARIEKEIGSSSSSQDGSGELVEGKLPFQADLALPLPTLDTRALRRYVPQNWKGPGHPTIATYLATPGGSLQEPYFLAALQLAYRLLWDPRSKTAHTFTVFVAPHISDAQRDLLSAVGALVKELDPVESPATSQFPRWKFQFAKLHLWSQWDFTRILFLDSDAFPFAPVDELFDLPLLGCKRELLDPEDKPLADIMCQYTFNVAPQGFQPKDTVAELNVGVMLLQPNDSMHKRLLRGIKKERGLDGGWGWETRMADQGYLSEMFKTEGPFPFESLERKWNGFFPQPNERGVLKIVHEKLWMGVVGDDDPLKWAKDDFMLTHQAMLRFFESEEFRKKRQKGEVKSFE